MANAKVELQQRGWHLSADGLARCEALCQQKNCKPSAKNLEKIALDLDLRSIGEQVLSDDLSRNLKHEVEGPLVLQVQRVRNVALPSTKQFSTQSNRRLLRIQLTDGRVSIPAVEIDKPIEKLSTNTCPGTKVLLPHKAKVQKGFLLLEKNSLEVLGGNVEHLVQKWNLTKITPDNLGRNSAGTSDAPQFSAFGSAKSAGSNSTKPKAQHTASRQSESKKPTTVLSTREAAVADTIVRGEEREKMELPKSEENLIRKAPRQAESQIRDGPRGKKYETAPHTRSEWVRGDADQRYRGMEEERERGGRGRGRGRGRWNDQRGGRRGEEYDQGKRTESSMLSDWLEQKLTVSSQASEVSREPQGVPNKDGEEKYWEEVWAYEESIAMAESEEQWRKEERERRERRESERGRRGSRGWANREGMDGTRSQRWDSRSKYERSDWRGPWRDSSVQEGKQFSNRGRYSSSPGAARRGASGGGRGGRGYGEGGGSFHKDGSGVGQQRTEDKHHKRTTAERIPLKEPQGGRTVVQGEVIKEEVYSSQQHSHSTSSGTDTGTAQQDVADQKTGELGRGASCKDVEEKRTVVVGRGRARGRVNPPSVPVIRRGRVTAQSGGEGRGGVGRGRGGGTPEEGKTVIGRGRGRIDLEEKPQPVEQPLVMAERDPEQLDTTEENDTSITSSGQYNWSWVQKGVPLGAKKL